MNELTPTDDLPAFLTTSEVAYELGISGKTVTRLCDLGILAHVTLSASGMRRIPVSEISRLLAMAQGNRR